MNGRRTTLLLITFLITDCGSRQTAVVPPTSPTGATVIPPSTSSSSPQSQIQSGPFTVAGIITDGSSRLSGASVGAFVVQPGFGYSYTWAHGVQSTNGAGEFRLPGLPAGVTVYIQASKDGSLPQCATPKLTISGDVTVNIQLVPMGRVSSSSSSLPPSPPGFRYVTGTVTRIVNGIKQPMPDTFVDYEPIMDFPAAMTRTDSDGRFALCGIPEDEPADVGAGSPSGSGFTRVPPGSHEPVEIVLR